MLARGLMRRCAACGGGGIFVSWFRMRERCPQCGYRFDREAGFHLGAWLVNLAVTEVLLVVLGIIPLIALLDSNPDANLWPIAAGCLAAGLIGAFGLYPHARTVWVALELMFRPAGQADPYDQR